MYYEPRSQYIRLISKKNSFRGNYSRKYGNDVLPVLLDFVQPCMWLNLLENSHFLSWFYYLFRFLGHCRTRKVSINASFILPSSSCLHTCFWCNKEKHIQKSGKLVCRNAKSQTKHSLHLCSKQNWRYALNKFFLWFDVKTIE